MPQAIPVVVLAIYALLLAVGGVVGYRKAGSRPSLIAGLSSSALAVVALVLARLVDPQLGHGLGLVLAFVLLLFFTRRFTTTRKFVPGGLMAVASLVVIVLLAASLLRSRGI